MEFSVDISKLKLLSQAFSQFATYKFLHILLIKIKKQKSMMHFGIVSLLKVFVGINFQNQLMGTINGTVSKELAPFAQLNSA